MTQEHFCNNKKINTYVSFARNLITIWNFSAVSSSINLMIESGEDDYGAGKLETKKFLNVSIQFFSDACGNSIEG